MRKRALPLITNNPNSDDRWLLLRAAGLLPYDDMVGYAFLSLALLAVGIALLLPGWCCETLFGGWIFSRDAAGDVHERDPK